MTKLAQCCQRQLYMDACDWSPASIKFDTNAISLAYWSSHLGSRCTSWITTKMEVRTLLTPAWNSSSALCTVEGEECARCLLNDVDDDRHIIGASFMPCYAYCVFVNWRSSLQAKHDCWVCDLLRTDGVLLSQGSGHTLTTMHIPMVQWRKTHLYSWRIFRRVHPSSRKYHGSSAWAACVL